MRAGVVIGGKYRLVDVVGQGAMGDVWQAEHTVTGRQVAVKLIRAAGFERQVLSELQARLLREAKACGRIAHRNVVEVHDAGLTDDGEPYLVMPLLRGESADKLLARDGKLEPKRVARITAELCRGLAAAHAKGITHRDLKPANIFLHQEDDSGGEPVVKILDFGVSRMPGADDTVVTRFGAVMGSPLYMSPEQTKGLPVGPATDIWSLGVIVFELASGKRLFQAKTQYMIAQEIMNGTIPKLSDATDGVDAGLAAFVDACLQRDPASRPAGALDLVHFLEPASPAETAKLEAPPSRVDVAALTAMLTGDSSGDQAETQVMRLVQPPPPADEAMPSLPENTVEAQTSEQSPQGRRPKPRWKATVRMPQVAKPDARAADSVSKSSAPSAASATSTVEDQAAPADTDESTVDHITLRFQQARAAAKGAKAKPDVGTGSTAPVLVPAPARSSKAWALLAALIAATVALIVVFAVASPSLKAPPTVASATPSAPVTAVRPGLVALEAAKARLASGDVDGAHLAAITIADESVRDDPRFKEIEAAWADAAFEKVNKWEDADAAEELLTRIVATPTVDAARRKKAIDMLEAYTSAPPASAVPVLTGRLPVPSATPEPSTSAMAGRAESEAIVDRVLPRAADGTASLSDLKLLRAACKHLKKDDCRRQAESLIERRQKLGERLDPSAP